MSTLSPLHEITPDGERPTPATCPFLDTLTGEEVGIYPHGVTCRIRRDRTRAPSTDELAWFCTNGRHHGCPTYREARSR